MQKISNPFEELLVGLVDAKVQFVTVDGLAGASVILNKAKDPRPPKQDDKDSG